MRNFRTSLTSIRVALPALMLAGGMGWVSAAVAQAPSPAVGPGSVIVHSKFGGQIFGFDIDQNGTEGVLAEAQTLPDGHVLAAVETFDQLIFTARAVAAQLGGTLADDRGTPLTVHRITRLREDMVVFERQRPGGDAA